MPIIAVCVKEEKAQQWFSNIGSIEMHNYYKMAFCALLSWNGGATNEHNDKEEKWWFLNFKLFLNAMKFNFEGQRRVSLKFRIWGM